MPDPLATLQSLRVHCEAYTVLCITMSNILRGAEGMNIWTLWPFGGHRAQVIDLLGFTPRSFNRLLARAG